MWLVPLTPEAGGQTGRSVRCDDVRRCNSVIGVARNCGFLGPLVRSVPDDGARARQGCGRRAGRVARRQSELGRSTRAHGAIPDSVHSNSCCFPRRARNRPRSGRAIRGGHPLAGVREAGGQFGSLAERKSLTVAATSRCSTSTEAFIARMSSSEILPASSLNASRSSGRASRTAERTIGTA